MKRFFELKIQALLHDPPDKMWVLERGRSHEERAREIYSRVFRETLFGGVVPQRSPLVAWADQMASSMDRFIHYVWQTSRKFIVYKRLHNIFSPDIYREIGDVSDSEVERYLSELGGLMRQFCREARSGEVEEEAARRCYHVFYALYEGLWIKEGLPPSLADTRAPTHDVFDHLYATAMLINWLYKGAAGGVDGFLVAVDIPGVQSFVSAARKAGDFWAGSWIISTAVWLTVWPLVWEYGPDILIRPTARLNPYYYASLTHKVPGVKSRLSEILGRVAGVPAHDGLLDMAVLMPLIGESAVLALPKFKPDGGQWTPEDLKSYIKNRFVDVLDALSKLAMGHGDSEFADFPILANLAKAAPPHGDLFKAIEREVGCSLLRLPLRVTVVDVGEFYKSLKCPLGGLGEDNCKALFFFHKLWTEALGRAAEEQSRRFVPTAGPWFQLTNDFDKAEPMCKPLYSDPTGYRLSSISGEPAVIGVRKEPGGDYNKYDLDNLAKRLSTDSSKLAALIKAGEFLGPSDLVKRGLYKRAASIIKFESTEDVAVSAIAAKLSQFEEVLKKYERCEKVLQYLRQVEGRDLESVWGSPDAMVRDWGKCVEEVSRVVAGGQASVTIEDSPFVHGGSLSEALGPRLFYAVVRGDGDHVGRLLRGDVENWCGKAVKVLEEVFRGRDEGERREVVNSLKSLCEITGGRPLVTPTYISAVSRSLVMTSLKDWVTTIHLGGMLIYAGGDDVVALYPAERAISAAERHRLNYWGDSGFHIVGRYAAPATVAFGRSFVVRFAHVMDIMAEELAQSFEDLEHYAKKARWGSFDKDSLVVTSSRSRAVAVLPFREPKKTAELLLKWWGHVLDDNVSSGLPHDAEPLWEVKDDDAFVKLCEYYVRRNTKKQGTVNPEELCTAYQGLWGEDKAPLELLEALKILRRLP